MSSRTYFHSKSCQVMQLSEVLNDHDSDDDCDIADHKVRRRCLKCPACMVIEESFSHYLKNAFRSTAN